MNRLSMQFDAPRARGRDPQTSHDAAEKASHRVASDRAIVFDVIRLARERGATMKDVAATGRIAYHDASRRGAEMERQGLIVRNCIGMSDKSRDGLFCIRIYEKRNGCAVWRVK